MTNKVYEEHYKRGIKSASGIMALEGAGRTLTAREQSDIINFIRGKINLTK